MASTYQIKAGDTLGHVAAAHQLTLAELLAANKQIASPNSIQVGQVINLPVPTAPPAAAASVGAAILNIGLLKGQLAPEVLAQIPAIVEKFKIDTPLKLAHFLAQCAHESCNFKAVSENLNYSAAALKSTFGKYFTTDALCDSYARKPEAIGARVYASRMGNGDEASKDGWTFRGRGYIQLTGKSNYTAFAKFVSDNILATPDLVAQKYPLLSAAWFFYVNKLIELSAQGATDDVVTLVTKRVNGGINGLAERIQYFKTYYALLHP